MPNPSQSPALQEAFARREQGGSTPALGQVSPQAPTGQQVPQPASPSSLGQAAAPPQSPEMPKFEPQNRKDLITMALIEQLKNDNKLDKDKMKLATQPAPEPAQSSVAPPPQPSQQDGQGAGGFSLSPGFQQPMAKNQMQGNYQSGAYTGLNNFGKGA